MKNRKYLDYFFPIIVFCICLYGAILIDPEFCPDERGRQLLSSFIYKNGRLPTGNEPETIVEGWGFSYALKPYLSAIINAIFMKAASFFTSAEQVLLVMSRMCSVLSVTGLCIFCQKTGKLLFQYESSAYLLSVIVCFFPQVIFLGMYQNNDALSLLGVSMILYFCVRGDKEQWTIKNCIGLAVAFSICVLSYYTVYPWVLMGGVFFVFSCIYDSGIENKFDYIGRRAGVIVGAVLILAGWFFVRNAMLHQGDFLGLVSETISREQFEAQGVPLYEYKSSFQKGKNFIEFLSDKGGEWARFTVQSCIGYFGHMLYPLPQMLYRQYYICIGIVFLLFFRILRKLKKNFLPRALGSLIFCSSVIVTGLSLVHSYIRDYEPQGRYIITVVLMIGWMTVYVSENSFKIENEKRSLMQNGAIIILWIILFAQAWFGTLSKLILHKFL